MMVPSNEFQPNLFDLPAVGFEPTLPKKTELKSAALDHSAIQAANHVVAHLWLSWESVRLKI